MNSSPSRLHAASLALLALASCSCLAQISAASQRPNIVLILADDLGIHDLHCYGRADQPTPNLDRLAAAGMQFSCAYTAQPICSASRAALMTGLTPARLNLTNYLPGRADAPSQPLLQPRIEGQLPLEQVTLPELLRDAGYATGMFGKWHLGGPGFGPTDQGFDVAQTPEPTGPPTLATGGKAEFAITDAAIDFISAHRDQPFFCYVAHHNPHIPVAAAPELVARHQSAFHPGYAAMIETLDQAVGKLLDHLTSLQLDQRTLVVFTSDNGGLHVLESPGTPATFNRPYRAGKGYLYEGGLREPLLVRWPGTVAPASRCDTPIMLTDLVPTLLAAAGIDPNQTVGPLEGIDLTQALQGEPLPARTLYWHFPHYTNQGSRPAGAVRDGQWKLIEHYEDHRVELFDVQSDPSEKTNLAAQQPEVADQLLQKLNQWRLSVGAKMPTANPDFQPDLHRRLYVDPDPSQLIPADTAAKTAPAWEAWRLAMNEAVRGRSALVTPAQGDIRLHAKDARVHAQTMRYEPQPYKNVLGYWINPNDWADWEFEVVQPGRYEVEIQQGCGQGSGGAEVDLEVAQQTLTFHVQETGHFQHMIVRTIGQVDLAAGKQTLAVKPRSKPGPAVMDVRRVVLRPIP